MIEPTPLEAAALRDLEDALAAGESLAAEGRSAGARRKELRSRLDELAGPRQAHPAPAAWLEARERALARMRGEMGAEIEELRGELERHTRGLARLFPPPRAREIHGRRIRKILDLLEILGRLAEIREIRKAWGEAGPGARPPA